jgi:hypothetical protein
MNQENINAIKDFPSEEKKITFDGYKEPIWIHCAM